MRHPWQVWMLYVFCLAVVAPAMAWVTSKALELDRAEYAARRQAEQEEEVSRALWRIDARLTPLLAEEAARPDFVYQSLPSPGFSLAESDHYLISPPSYVLLHFELREAGGGSSPQLPPSAKTSGQATTDANNPYAARLAEITSQVSFDQLRDLLPEQTLPQLTLLAQNQTWNGREVPPQVVASNSPSYDDTTPPFVKNQLSGKVASRNAKGYAPTQAVANNEEQSPVQFDGQTNQNANQYAQQSSNARSQLESGLNKDLRSRDAAFQNYTQRAIVQQRQQAEQAKPNERATQTIREGISRPLWIGDKLLFAHRVQRGNENFIQGCWLDWPVLREQLLAEVSDLLPRADLLPLHSDDDTSQGRLLATLPVQLIVPPPLSEAPVWSPIRMALLVAWGCLALAAAASAWMLQAVVTLSERRAAFVSAVTHELRTPLTTFRMYAEMLADNIVTEPTQRQRYLETLRVEADRLTHLVENVLLYARLERGQPGKNRVTISIADLLTRVEHRLTDRAEQAGLTFSVACDAGTRELLLTTDPAAVEQVLFNLVDNAGKYAASASDRRLVFEISGEAKRVCLSIRDFGPGLSASVRRKLFQPFSKSAEEAAVSAPGVGLGLALCQRFAADLGGRLRHADAQPGAKFMLTLPRSSF